MTDHEFEQEDSDEYTRLQMTIQKGDGVDNRGDVTVEIKRERREGHEPGANMRKVRLPGTDEEVKIAAQDETFAEFYNEVDRSVSVMRDVLGLNDG